MRHTPEKTFSPEMVCKTSRQPRGILAKIIAHPIGAAHDIYIVVEKGGTIKFKLWVYNMEADKAELGRMFKMGWKTDNELIIGIPSRRVEISVFVKEGKATVRSLVQRIISPFELSSIRLSPKGGVKV
jgi:hypothetical protein